MFRAYLKVADACEHCGEELHHQRADEIGPRRDAHGQAVMHQLLRHQDGIAVVHRNHAIEFLEIHADEASAIKSFGA